MGIDSERGDRSAAGVAIFEVLRSRLPVEHVTTDLVTALLDAIGMEGIVPPSEQPSVTDNNPIARLHDPGDEDRS
jgi:hypothetical protein